MKILFSPSEAKFRGGENKQLDENSFIFPELFDKRLEAIKEYQNFINNASIEELEKLFGTKKQDIIDYYKGNILEKALMKVIDRYDGVAFDYLKYRDLKSKEKEYIDKNVLIFSNLFGPICAGDFGLPDYKLKQGEKIGTFALEKFYNDNFSTALDEYLKDEEVIDLRAGFYEKFYKINKPYTTMKFVKNNKVVSHWSKAYRGIILRIIAENDIQTIEQLINININNLSVIEIKKMKFKNEIVYDIKD
jgi:cytoplasmic iron level regulating protein YaaA (DUF328/UPF0246 family)